MSSLLTNSVFENMEINEFIRYLDNATIDDGNIRSESSKFIMSLRTDNPFLFFNLVFQVFDNENSSTSQVIVCLSAIRNMLLPSEEFQISQIYQNWYSDFMNEIRDRLKDFIFDLIHNEEYSIRGVSSSIYALIFAIETYKPFDDYWPQTISKFVDEFQSEESAEHCKLGIISFFHELMVLPIFSKLKSAEYHRFFLNELHRFLQPIIQNLIDPQSNSKTIFDYSILCLLDLITYAHEIFDGPDEITFLLQSYEIALQYVDAVQYQQLFDVLLQIIKRFYDNISIFMENIFDYVKKGIDCPNDDLVCISIGFWIELCRFEKGLVDSQSEIQIQNFALTSIEPMIQLLLVVISSINQRQKINDILIQSIDLISCFSEDYPEETAKILNSQINSLIFSEDEDSIFTSLVLIRGVCTKSIVNDNYMNFNKIFGRICWLIINYEITDEIISIPYAAMWAANRVVMSCQSIAYDQLTFDFIFELFQNPNIYQKCRYSLFELSKVLIKSSSKSLVQNNFADLFNIFFESLDNPEMTVDVQCLESNFSCLFDLVSAVKQRFDKLFDCYVQVFEKIDNYMNFLSTDGSREFLEFRLINILHLIQNFVEKLSIDFNSQCENLVEKLIKCTKKHHNLTYDLILNVFSSLCLVLKENFDKYSDLTANFIIDGIESQSPSTINESIKLCGYLIKYVDKNQINLFDNIFQLIDGMPPYQAHYILPTFIKTFSILLKKYPAAWPDDTIDRFYKIVEEQLNDPNLKIDSVQNDENFDFDYAARIYEASFYAYATYFKHQEASDENFKLAKFILKFALQCQKTGAYDCNTALALSKLLKTLIEAFENKISRLLNAKYNKKILNDALKFDCDIEYKVEIRRIINIIQNYSGKKKQT